ncbi:MAG: adenylate/guanylate cyclase domain-containing protein, partial [Bacteroidia bacterium]|nr:adenylate/guanylate cyclase domain-containing protein [Bacteroidia bacterium]
ILPDTVADELRLSGAVEPCFFDSASIMFIDFVGFTQICENMPPREITDTLNDYFSHFDELVERFSLEKLKTIGDAYMCAGGLPHPTEDHAERCVMAAQEIIKVMYDIKENSPPGVTALDIRIGINTGPVVAGVVGTKKFAYDIWGDAVNVASRMESNAEIGMINISDTTYQIVKDKFDITYRGEFAVKNRGTMKMYAVK